MIFQRPISWTEIGQFLLLFGLFGGSLLGLRYVTMVATGRGTISELDLLGAAAFGFFFARLAYRSKSARGRRIIAGAVLLLPPLVVLVGMAGMAVWDAWLQLTQN